MTRNDILLIVLFAVSASLLVYALGATITGYFMKTMYCDGEMCKDYCRFNSGCSGDEVCCDMQGFGVCRSASECEKEYVFRPQDDVSSEQMEVILQKPSPEYTKDAFIFTALLVLLIIIIALRYSEKELLKK